MLILIDLKILYINYNIQNFFNTLKLKQVKKIYKIALLQRSRTF